MDINQLFAAKIRELRIRHELTQSKCADLAGIGRKSYRRVEAGQTKRIRMRTIMQLAAAFGLKISELLELLEEEEKKA